MKNELTMIAGANGVGKTTFARAFLRPGLLYEKTARYNQAADELETYLKIEPKAANAAQIKELIENFRAKEKSKFPCLTATIRNKNGIDGF